MLIEVDEYKKKVLNYDSEQSELSHRESARLADKDFIEQLKTRKYSEVIFMAGGAASGKTEFCFSYLMNDYQLVYDGTLKNFDGFKIKLSNIKRYAKNKPVVKVILIMPQDWIRAFEAFLKRERKMPSFAFFDTHIRSKFAVAQVLKETDLEVEIFISVPGDRSEKLDYIPLDVKKNRDLMRQNLIATGRQLHEVAKSGGLNIEINYDNL